MNGTDVLDDYLGELLQSAQPATSTVAAEPAADAVVDLPAPRAESAAIAEPERMPEPEPVPAAHPAPVAAVAPVAAEVSPATVPATVPAPRPTAPAAPVPPPSARAPAPQQASRAGNAWAALQAQAREPQPPRQQRASERTSRWLRLRCGAQVYALELLKVQEVVLPVPLLGLRGTAASMLGIMNLRGQVVPVIDLGLHLGFAPIVEDSQTRIVVLEENGETMGLRVSAVEDVANLTDSQIEPPDTARICQISNSLFRGVARVGPQPMILLDASQLLQ